VVLEEIRRLLDLEERHRRLLARIVLALGLSLVVDVCGAILMWTLERNHSGTDIHTLGDALFFSTVQILTVSSQLRNPLTGFGRVVDVFLELWAIGVVTAIAGSFSTFFTSGDP
jgi:voltage-gated potassium channel